MRIAFISLIRCAVVLLKSLTGAMKLIGISSFYFDWSSHFKTENIVWNFLRNRHMVALGSFFWPVPHFSVLLLHFFPNENHMPLLGWIVVWARAYCNCMQYIFVVVVFFLVKSEVQMHHASHLNRLHLLFHRGMDFISTEHFKENAHWGSQNSQE